MTTAHRYDVAIIGAGPGGYVAGIRAAHRGLTACVIEQAEPGGVCLNWGCIPSKSLIHQATQFLALAEMESIGVKVDRSGLRYADVHAKTRAAATALATGVTGLLRRNKVDLIRARGTIAAVGRVALSGEARPAASVAAANIIVATGSRPMEVPGFEFDERQVLSSSGVLALSSLPESLLILGAGAIGCEFAYALNAFGVKVTLVEMAAQILPSEDREAAAQLADAMRRSGIDVRTGMRAARLARRPDRVEVALTSDSAPGETIVAQRVLAAFGRVPNTAELGLEELGVALERTGHVVTGDYGETSIKGIYAVGDITRSAALAHVAFREAEIAVDRIAGAPSHERSIDPSLVPSAVYTEPQVAGFGLREQEAVARGIPYRKSVFPYRAAGKSLAIGRPTGFVKILAAPDTGELLGAHIVGAEATELVQELLLARHAELLVDDVAATIHAHPTLSEAVSEAARGLVDRPIHI